MSFLSQYYPNVKPERLAVLEDMWRFAQDFEPMAEEGLSYGLPALKLHGRPFIGFGLAKNYMSLYPFSPKIVDAVRGDLGGFDVGKGAIRFTHDNVVPKAVVEVVMELRKRELVLKLDRVLVL